MALDWYVGKTQRGKEWAFRMALGGHGIEVFNPEITVARRGRKQFEPLFPTYIFCRVDPKSYLWPQIRWATGLSYFLGAEGTPAAGGRRRGDDPRCHQHRWRHGGSAAGEPAGCGHHS